MVEHIEAQHGRIPFAVVSGSTRDPVIASLVSLKLLDKFDALVCAGDYQKGKPDPEAFLEAAAKLGVPPEYCLVFEDADMGIEAAAVCGAGFGEGSAAVGTWRELRHLAVSLDDSLDYQKLAHCPRLRLR